MSCQAQIRKNTILARIQPKLLIPQYLRDQAPSTRPPPASSWQAGKKSCGTAIPGCISLERRGFHKCQEPVIAFKIGFFRCYLRQPPQLFANDPPKCFSLPSTAHPGCACLHNSDIESPSNSILQQTKHFKVIT
jgi:hypothetical protein